VALGVAGEVLRSDIRYAPLVHDAVRNKTVLDQLAKPRRSLRIELVIICGHFVFPLFCEELPSENTYNQSLGKNSPPSSVGPTLSAGALDMVNVTVRRAGFFFPLDNLDLVTVALSGADH
jgi:hypothetical protein